MWIDTDLAGVFGTVGNHRSWFCANIIRNHWGRKRRVWRFGSQSFTDRHNLMDRYLPGVADLYFFLFRDLLYYLVAIWKCSYTVFPFVWVWVCFLSTVFSFRLVGFVFDI